MNIIACKKCGTKVITDSALLENMYDAMVCATKAAKNTKTNAQRTVLIQEASQIKKLITQVMHRTVELERWKFKTYYEYLELVAYIRENKLISDEKLTMLNDNAREKARNKVATHEKEITKIYGDFESMLVNRTKKDATAEKAIRNAISVESEVRG